MRIRKPMNQYEFAAQMIETLGRKDALKMCREHMWYGTMEVIERRMNVVHAPAAFQGLT